MQTEIAIVGAGPAGMAAAIEARAQGAQVVLLDEQAAAGGQVYRAVQGAPAERLALLGPDYAAGRALAQAFEASGARHLHGAAVWQIESRSAGDHRIDYRADSATASLHAARVLLCTGAMERPFPIPGWTLPGVMTAGAAQIALKTGGLLPARPTVLAGCGPLLYLLAWQYLQAGMRPAAIVDSADPAGRWRAVRHLPGALANWPLLRKGLGLLKAVNGSGVPVYRGAQALAIEGRGRAEALSFEAAGRREHLACDLVLLHQGVVPDTQLSMSLRAEHDWNPSQLCWLPRTDRGGQLSVPGIHVAGDGASIVGAQAAEIAGRSAALSALASLRGEPEGGPLLRRARMLQAQLRRATRIRRFLEALYRPLDAHRLPPDEALVCRCEEVSAGALRAHVRLGCLGPNQAKAFSRCGMGPCQGRLCSLTVTELIAAERGVSPAEVGALRVRPPVRPVSLRELAAAPADDR